MGGGALRRDNQHRTFAHIHKSSSRSTTSPWSPIPYPHCASTWLRWRAVRPERETRVDGDWELPPVIN